MTGSHPADRVPTETGRKETGLPETGPTETGRSEGGQSKRGTSEQGPPGGSGYVSAAAARAQVVETVHRIMGSDNIAGIDTASNDTASNDTASNDTASNDTAPKARVAAAVEQAGGLAQTGRAGGQAVLDAAREQAGDAATEVGQQVRQLWGRAASEVTDQAGTAQQRLADGLHSAAEELAGLVEHADQPGVVTDLAGQAADRARQAAGWLQGRDPADLLEQVRFFAKQRPAAFLSLAVGAGIVAGRLARGLTATDAPTTSTKNLAR